MPKPVRKQEPFRLVHGNCLDVLATLDAMSIDSCVTDPPYEIGMMSKKWDSTGIANDSEMWKYVLRALKPGGRLLAFSATRTYHRMACAIEDAGFEIVDQIGWAFASGFPKSHNVSKGIDKADGWEREKKVFDQKPGMAKSWDTGGGRGFSGTEAVEDTPICEDAQLWNGWGSALKPAWEPICCAMRPLKGSIQRNVREYGTGGLNIDACRVGTEGGTRKLPSDVKCGTVATVGGYLNARVGVAIDAGRWPANLVHDGSPEVLALFPRTGPSRKAKSTSNPGTVYGAGKGLPSHTGVYGFDEPAGSAARFFYCAKSSSQDRDEGLEGLLQNAGAMCGRTDGTLDGEIPQRINVHPTVKPTSLMRWLVRLVTPPGGTVLDPFTGSGSTGKACGLEGFKFLGIEMSEEYLEIARQRIAFGYSSRESR